jgi:hypothetical protein
MIVIILMIFFGFTAIAHKIRSKIKIRSKSPPDGGYFFGSAMAWAATHCHSPFRSTQVSVNR